MPVDMTSSSSQIFLTTQEGRNHVLFHFSIKVRSYAKSQKYYRIHDLLHSVCEGIRNPLVHPVITDIDIIYTEEEAKNIINRVKVFINDFAQL